MALSKVEDLATERRDAPSPTTILKAPGVSPVMILMGNAHVAVKTLLSLNLTTVVIIT
jgi:hypothetical protein